MSLFVGAALMEEKNAPAEPTLKESTSPSRNDAETETSTTTAIAATTPGDVLSSELVPTLDASREGSVADRSETPNSFDDELDVTDAKEATISRRDDEAAGAGASTGRRRRWFGRKKKDGGGSGGGAVLTTGLILEHRPANLPAKSASEVKKHRLEYEKMLALAKKKEKQALKEKKKKEAEKEKKEKIVSSSIEAWKTDIVPNWDAVCGTKLVQEKWWHGLPSSVRGVVWPKAIGNSLQITEDLYKIFLARAHEKLASKGRSPEKEIMMDPDLVGKDHEKSVEMIHLDVSRTFPRLCMFQKGGPLYDDLHDVLGAYACYRPDVGYVQGMSFLAAVFLLYVSPSEAFVCLAGILNRPCHLAFFRVDEKKMSAYFGLFTTFFEEHLPKLSAHFESLNVTPDMFLIDWIYALYSKALPLDVACRVWDVYFRDGDIFLFRTALGILSMYHNEMLEMEFIDLGRFFTRLPDSMSVEKLFEHISRIGGITPKRYAQVLAHQLSLTEK